MCFYKLSFLFRVSLDYSRSINAVLVNMRVEQNVKVTKIFQTTPVRSSIFLYYVDVLILIVCEKFLMYKIFCFIVRLIKIRRVAYTRRFSVVAAKKYTFIVFSNNRKNPMRQATLLTDYEQAMICVLAHSLIRLNFINELTLLFC